MSVERTEQVVKPVHITMPEAAVAVGSGITIGAGIVAAPLLAMGGVLVGVWGGLRVCYREAYEKARQRSEFEKQGEIVGK